MGERVKIFAFGTDEQRCDVVLAPRGVRQTSGVHFHIKFDDVIDGKRGLVLKGSSSNGTAVSYSGQAEDEVRRHFTWILNLEMRDRRGRIKGGWDVEVHVRGFKFKVKLVSHETYATDYNKNVNKLLQHSRTIEPPPGGLGSDRLLMEVTRDLKVDRDETD